MSDRRFESVIRLLIPVVGTATLIGAWTTARAQQPLAPENLRSYTERVPTGFLNWGEGFAEITVEAAYETERFGASHAKIRAIEDAEKKADEAFFRLLRGINVDGQKRIAGDPALEKVVREVARKQRSVQNRHTADVTMKVDFRMPLFGKKALASAIAEAVGKDTGSVAANSKRASGGAHTSVVFDASGTTLQAALLPRVFSENGELLYGPGAIDPKALERGSPVTYLVRSDSGPAKKFLKTLQQEIGDNPLVLKVGKISGEFLADIVLRAEQEQQLRAAQPADLFAQGRVFVVQTRSVDLTAQ